MAAHKHADLIKQMVDDDTLRVTYGIEDTTYEAMSVLVYPQYEAAQAWVTAMAEIRGAK